MSTDNIYHAVLFDKNIYFNNTYDSTLFDKNSDNISIKKFPMVNIIDLRSSSIIEKLNMPIKENLENYYWKFAFKNRLNEYVACISSENTNYSSSESNYLYNITKEKFFNKPENNIYSIEEITNDHKYTIGTDTDNKLAIMGIDETTKGIFLTLDFKFYSGYNILNFDTQTKYVLIGYSERNSILFEKPIYKEFYIFDIKKNKRIAKRILSDKNSSFLDINFSRKSSDKLIILIIKEKKKKRTLGNSENCIFFFTDLLVKKVYIEKELPIDIYDYKERPKLVYFNETDTIIFYSKYKGLYLYNFKKNLCIIVPNSIIKSYVSYLNFDPFSSNLFVFVEKNVEIFNIKYLLDILDKA